MMGLGHMKGLAPAREICRIYRASPVWLMPGLINVSFEWLKL